MSPLYPEAAPGVNGAAHGNLPGRGPRGDGGATGRNGSAGVANFTFPHWGCFAIFE